MKQVLDNIRAECYICKTPLNGRDLLMRGSHYYCPSDYEKTSPEELYQNRDVREDSEFIQRILGTDYLNLTLNHDFTDWTVTSGTATSAKVWTSQAGGSIYKDLSLVFGETYKIKTVISPTAGSVVIYNSNDSSKQIGTGSIDTTFIALTKYLEFYNASASTNTISFIEIRKL